MLSVLSSVLFGAAFMIVVPSAVLFIEVMAASVLRRSKNISEIGSRGPIGVLIPAHNEESGIVPTIQDVLGQLRPDDRLVVIADNCTDRTDAVALAAGADVIIRSDRSRIGKGYALDWGMTSLAKAPPETVIIIDADCRVSDGCIENLAATARQLNRPIQSLYLMESPPASGVAHHVAEFAWLVKNHVRPLGLKAMGMPCQLMGTGMAFPWSLLREANLSNGHIVEDLKLGLELAARGVAPEFLPAAKVRSTFPVSQEGTRTQRQRWEHGHLDMIVSQAPKLLIVAAVRRDLRLVGLAFDLLVPPLSLLVMLIGTVTIATGIGAVAGLSIYPFVVSLMSCLLLVGAIFLSWWLFGRDVLPSGLFRLIPGYMVMKVPIYFEALLGRRVSSWIRSDRS